MAKLKNALTFFNYRKSIGSEEMGKRKTGNFKGSEKFLKLSCIFNHGKKSEIRDRKEKKNCYRVLEDFIFLLNLTAD